ncbi:hypothetical protein GCM10020258_34910 [Sphingomonas yabuuchiae]
MAARIGPTVCELEGPMPIVNSSVTLTAAILSSLRGVPTGMAESVKIVPIVTAFASSSALAMH